MIIEPKIGEAVVVNGRGTSTIKTLLGESGDVGKPAEEWLAELTDGSAWWIGNGRTLTLGEEGEVGKSRTSWQALRPGEG